MRILIGFVLLALSWLHTTNASAAAYYTYINGGSTGFWGDASTWTTDPSGISLVGSAVPGNGDLVYILNGYTVILNANVTTTGLTIVINNGGTLDLATHTMATITTLSGAGLLKINSGYFPTITNNTFRLSQAAGATVEFYDFTGTLPPSVEYPNITLSNSTASDHTITFSNSSAYTLRINGNFVTRATGTGNLAVLLGSQAGGGIDVNFIGNVTVGTNTTFGVGIFNARHDLVVTGNFTNDGTVDFSNTAQYTSPSAGYATLTFVGAADKTLACNGVTDLYNLVVDKGLGSTNILSVTSTNVNNLRFFSNGELYTVTNGTLRLGANISIDRVRGSGTSNYNLGDGTRSPMLWIDGADVNFRTIALVVYGKFRISAGSFSSLGGEGTVIRLEGQYIIEGGTFTTEKFRPSTETGTHRGSFIMTGGTFNAQGEGSNAAYARFSLPYPEQVFIMSGGTINVSEPENGGGASNGGIHIGCNASNYNVTGGTFNAILSGDASAFRILSTAPFWNLNILRTAGGPVRAELNNIGSVSGTLTTVQPLVVLNQFSIDGANNPSFRSNGQPVTLGGDFTINSGGSYDPNGNTTTFNGSTDQDFVNDGTITSGLYNLTIDKPSGTLTLGGSATTYTVTNTLDIARGILNDGGKSIQVTGAINNSAVHTGTGNITINGTATQTITGDGDGVFGNLVLSNNSVPGVKLESDIAVSATLTLAGNGNSLFDIAHYRLSLTSSSGTALTTSGNPFSSAKMIRTSGFQSDRGVEKTFGNLSAFTFAVGVRTNYTPATIQFAGAPTTYGTIVVRPVDFRHQFVTAGNTNNLSFYWKVTSNGFTGVPPNGVSHTYQYAEASVSPAGGDAGYVPSRYNPTAWTVISDLSAVDETANRIMFNNTSFIDGEYTAGYPAAFGPVKIFYSIRSGNWTDTNPGTTPWSNVSHTGAPATSYPVVGDHVYIGDGFSLNHIITITNNGQASGGLEISAGSTLDVGTTTGHNFGTLENAVVGGSGLLRISSATAVAQFPAGDFGNFIRASGGTVEYYTTGTQNFTIPVVSAGPTNLPLDSYNHLVLTPSSGHFIQLPDSHLSIYQNLTVQGDPTGVVRINSASSRTLTIDGNLAVSSGVFQFRNNVAQDVQVTGDVLIGTAGTFNVAATGTAVENNVTLTGNIVNNGILDLSNGTQYANAVFTGAMNRSITGTGSITDFHVLTVSKGTSPTSVLNVDANAFSLSGSGQPLVLTTGTFRLSSAQAIVVSNGVDFDIPAVARLSANGGTINLTGADEVDLHLAGILEVMGGTINVGTTGNDNAIVYAATGEPTIRVSGGTLNVTGQIRRSFASSQGALIYDQSGVSTVSVGIAAATTTTRGVFEILNTGSSFTMTGGTLRINRGSGSTAISDLYLHPSVSSVSGGTITTGTTATSGTVDVNSIIPVYSFAVEGAATTTARLEFNGLVMRGGLTIGAGNIFQASGFNVSIGGNFVNANTGNLTGTNTGGYRPGSATQTTTFNGTTGHQSVSGVSGNLTNFANLVINNTFTGGTVTLQPDTELRINGTLTLNNGTLAGTTNIITAVGSVMNSATHTSTTGSIRLAGTTSQMIGGNGNGKFGNVVLNNASGAVFTASQEVTGTLTFTNGSLFIGSHGLKLSNTDLSAIIGASSSRYIISTGNLSDEGVTKAFAPNVTAGNFVYPIGVSGKYTPANYTITTGGLGGTISISPVNSKHPSATGAGTAYLNYYWNVRHSVIILDALTHTYTYVASDEAGNPADYRDARFKGGAWTIGTTPGNPNTTTRVITFVNTDLAGDYTAGEPTAFVNPTTYTSVASGTWESDLSVWDVDPPGTNLGPPAGSFVIIQEGHTITVSGNGKRMATLEVRGRLHLGNTIGHDFGVVTTGGSGERTIQLQSSTFPSGNFSSFTATNGGTVEYNGTVILPTRTTYNNIAFTGPGTKTLPNADLSINGSLTIYEGNVTNAVNNRSVVLFSASGDFTNRGQFISGTGPVIIGRHLINEGTGTVFNAGNGGIGLQVGGNVSNRTSAVFNGGSAAIDVSGSIINNSAFNAGSGAITIAGDLNNVTGTFAGASGSLDVSGSLTNNAAFTAGTGSITVGAAFSNGGTDAIYTANATSLSVAGDYSNLASAVFNANTGNTTVGGNWNNGATFNAGTGRVTFNGVSSQQLTGGTDFYNLARSNGGSLVLNSNVNVAGMLTLSGGNIITGTRMISLTNTSQQPVSVYGAGSFVDGRLAISYPDAATTSRTFPVGKGTVYRPVTIQQTLGSSTPVVRVEMINTPPTGTEPATIERLSEARYYSIDLLSGTMNGPTVQLPFNTNAPVDELIAVPGNARIVRALVPSGPWTDEGGTGVFSPAAPAGYATSGVTSIAGTTFFALGYQDPALPITLLSFGAHLEGGMVELKWSTASEINNAYFTIERSGSSELQFDSIGFVPGAGNSNTVLRYHELDVSPLPGISYYRLKQTDFDGRSSFSKIVRIENHHRPSLSIYPNPADVGQPVTIVLHNESQQELYLTIANVTGRVVFEGVVGYAGSLQVNGAQQHLEPGVYFINVRSGRGYYRQKLVVR